MGRYQVNSKSFDECEFVRIDLSSSLINKIKVHSKSQNHLLFERNFDIIKLIFFHRFSL